MIGYFVRCFSQSVVDFSSLRCPRSDSLCCWCGREVPWVWELYGLEVQMQDDCTRTHTHSASEPIWLWSLPRRKSNQENELLSLSKLSDVASICLSWGSLLTSTRLPLKRYQGSPTEYMHEDLHEWTRRKLLQWRTRQLIQLDIDFWICCETQPNFCNSGNVWACDILWKGMPSHITGGNAQKELKV